MLYELKSTEFHTNNFYAAVNLHKTWIDSLLYGPRSTLSNEFILVKRNHHR